MSNKAITKMLVVTCSADCCRLRRYFEDAPVAQAYADKHNAAYQSWIGHSATVYLNPNRSTAKPSQAGEGTEK